VSVPRRSLEQIAHDHPSMPLRRYAPTIIASCPECCTDLQDEAFSYWCATCRRSWSFTEVAFFDDGDIRD